MKPRVRRKLACSWSKVMEDADQIQKERCVFVRVSVCLEKTLRFGYHEVDAQNFTRKCAWFLQKVRHAFAKNTAQRDISVEACLYGLVSSYSLRKQREKQHKKKRGDNRQR